MTDPLEARFMEIMQLHGITYTRPEKDGSHGSRLDFWLPQFGLAVEVKSWSSERQHEQLKDERSAMLLIGIDGVNAFGKILRAVKRRAPTAPPEPDSPPSDAESR